MQTAKDRGTGEKGSPLYYVAVYIVVLKGIFILVPGLDKFPHLTARLGKARTDRLRYALQGQRRRQPGAVNVDNPLVDVLQGIHPKALPTVISDILTGIAYLDEPGSTEQLSVQRLFNILQTLPILNTREIQRMTGLGDRQARRYMRAVKTALPFLVKALKHKDFTHAQEEISPLVTAEASTP